ncbi:MAG: hypothetical protein R3254_10150 [Thiomicrorhabdus sp.]|nr:hypothetical protein [Thiomicrorhabdus sp.]
MKTKDYDKHTHNPKPDSLAASQLFVQAANHKLICDEPAYLFWKVQSRLAKLTNRLRLEKKIILKEASKTPQAQNQPVKDSDQL